MVKEMFLVTGEVGYHFVNETERKYRKVNAITARPIKYNNINGSDLSYFSHSIQENFYDAMSYDNVTKEQLVIDDIVVLTFKSLGVQDTDDFTPEAKEEEPEKEEVQQ